MKDLEPPGGAVDQVHDVVESGGEEVDVLTVERGDEHPVEAGDHVVGDLVGQVLEALDLVHDGAALVAIGAEQVVNRAGGLDVQGGDRGEQVEELLIAGQQRMVESLEDLSRRKIVGTSTWQTCPPALTRPVLGPSFPKSP